MIMKRYILSLIALLMVIPPLFAYQYQVNVSSTLNLRSEPSASSEILLKLNNGDIVDCQLPLTESQTGWIKVEYHGTTGFLKAQYLTPVKNIQKEEYKASASSKQWYELLDWEGTGYSWMAYLICGLVLVMWFECKFIRQLEPDFWHANNNGGFKWRLFNGLLLFITSCSIFFYIFQMGINSLWFFFPSIVDSWLLVILDFVIFVYVLINLLVFFLKTMDDMAEAANTQINLKFGLFAWLAGIIAMVICGIGNYDPTFIYIIIGISQIIQVGIILYQLTTKGYFLLGLTTSLLYLIGTTAIVLLATCLAFVLVILAIIAIVLAFVLKINMAPGGMLSDKDGMPNSNGHATADGDFTIINSEGQRTRLTQNNGDIFNGSDGHTYQRTGNTFNKI